MSLSLSRKKALVRTTEQKLAAIFAPLTDNYRLDCFPSYMKRSLLLSPSLASPPSSAAPLSFILFLTSPVFALPSFQVFFYSLFVSSRSFSVCSFILFWFTSIPFYRLRCFAVPPCLSFFLFPRPCLVALALASLLFFSISRELCIFLSCFLSLPVADPSRDLTPLLNLYPQ